MPFQQLEPRHALFALKAFQQRGLLAADVGAGPMVDEEVEVEAVDVVLADQFGFVSLIDRRLQPLTFTDELAAHIDVTGVSAHCEAGDQAALDEKMRIVPHNVAILAGPGLGLIGVDHKIMGPVASLLGHERPLEPGWEPSAAATAQARVLDLADDGVAAFLQDRLGAVPGAARTGAGQAPVAAAVEIAKDAILVIEHRLRLTGPPSLGRRSEWCRRRAERRIAARSAGQVSGFHRGRWRRALSRRTQGLSPRRCRCRSGPSGRSRT